MMTQTTKTEKFFLLLLNIIRLNQKSNRTENFVQDFYEDSHENSAAIYENIKKRLLENL